MLAVAVPRYVEVPPRSVAPLGRFIGARRLGELQARAAATVRSAGSATIWNLSSTQYGGGVAEMLRLLVAYAETLGVDTRWVVIDGDPEFFAITKRVHNRLHGAAGDGGALGPAEAAHYSDVLRANVDALDGRIRRDDVVFLHDPQTAGLASHLLKHGVRVAWRCHVGADHANAFTEEAWGFLKPHLDECHTFVFSHAAFVPPMLAGADVWVISPSIDPTSPKNAPMPKARATALLARIGLLEGPSAGGPSAVLGGAGPLPAEDPLVVQVSRWDRLKDMRGVMEGFAARVVGSGPARLALVGPQVEGVSDDPEELEVLGECLDAWASLPPAARDAIRLVALPMNDVVANAHLVNAVQRHASVVTQKSLQEGFGLTVTEAMWKSRPVVASAVGGIIGQVPPGTGILIDDPRDLEAFGSSLAALLARPAEMAALGKRAHQHVRAHFLSDRHLIDYARLLEHLTGG
ncbi:MAG: glycosyltransferase [Acidimicrobiales bacterium]